MRTARMKLVGSVGIPLILGWIALAAIARAQSPEPAVVLSAAWGAKPGQVGGLFAEEMERCGPLSFCVDGDTVFLLDSVNRRLLRVVDGAAIGAAKEMTPSVLATDVDATALCPDGNGGVWIQNGPVVERIDAQGRRNARKTLADKTALRAAKIEGYGVELRRDHDGVIALRGLDRETVVVAATARTADEGKDEAPTEGKTPTSDASSPSTSASSAASTSASSAAPSSSTAAPVPASSTNADTPLRYSIKRMSGNAVRILGLDPGGKALASVEVRIDSGALGAVLFKGTDAQGNLYVELERIDGGRANLEVHRYAPSGQRLHRFKLPNTYHTTVYKKAEVISDGSVYQMLTTPEGVRVIRHAATEEEGR